MLKILHYTLKKDKKMGSYFTTIEPEAYDTGKNHFIPRYRSIFVSGDMYPNTDKNFVYITSDLHGTWRGYRCRNTYDMGIANIFASGKTLDEAVKNFEYNLKHYKYNSK